MPGGKAERPSEIPARGWKQVVKRGWKEAKADQVPLLAAGVAFYAFLSIFPALIAIVTIYGLFADPSTIADQLNSVTTALPGQARQVITDQVTLLASRRSTLGIGLILSIVIALWSASAGISNLLIAINVAYDEQEKRGFVKKRLLSLGLTLGAIVFMVIMLGIVAVLPPLLKAVFGTSALRWVLQILGWLIVVVLVAVVLAILYRLAPDRDAPQMRWVSVGAAVATVIWLIASIGFSIYSSTFGNYAKTYGVFAGIVVLLFWLWLTMYAILLGARSTPRPSSRRFPIQRRAQRSRWASAARSRQTRFPQGISNHPARRLRWPYKVVQLLGRGGRHRRARSTDLSPYACLLPPGCADAETRYRH